MTGSQKSSDPASEDISVHSDAPSAAAVDQATVVLNDALGDGYVNAARLAQLVANGGVLVRAIGFHGRIIGAATEALCLTFREYNSRVLWSPFMSQRLIKR